MEEEKFASILEGLDYPFVNEITLTGVVAKIRDRKDAANDTYYEIKLISAFNYTEFSNLFNTDKDRLEFNANIPLVIYPVTNALKNFISGTVSKVQEKELIAVRGFLMSNVVDKVDFATNRLRKEVETFVHILGLQRTFTKIQKVNFQELGLPINHALISGIVIDKYTATGRDGRTLVGLSIVTPRMLSKPVSQRTENETLPYELVDVVYFRKDGDYLANTINISDYVLVRGRLINKFFEKSLFPKIKRYYLIDAYSVVTKHLTKQNEKNVLGKVAQVVKDEKADDDIAKLGVALEKYINNENN
ncbi:MAG: hypothetical protein QW735_03290 [archaeon]